MRARTSNRIDGSTRHSRWRLVSAFGRMAVFAIVAHWGVPARASPAHALTIRVAHATAHGAKVDDRLKDLAKQLAELKYTSVTLKDQAKLKLDLGTSGRMQLPGGEWMTVVPRKLVEDGKLRLEIAVKKLKFKTSVLVASGATVAIRGPAFQDGTLVLAITREATSP